MSRNDAFRSARIALAVCLALTLAGCGLVFGTREDVAKMQAHFVTITGDIRWAQCDHCEVVLVATRRSAPITILGFRIFERPGRVEAIVPADTTALFAFHDTNHNFAFDPGEPFGTVEWSGSRPAEAPFELTIGETGNVAPPLFAPISSLLDSVDAINDDLRVRLGEVVSLDDPRFHGDIPAFGMWEPLKFLQAGHAGIYVLEPFNPRKTPVLYVHGIMGSPAQFSALVAGLDRQRFQPWFVYYPSGLEIGAVSSALLGIVNKVRHRYAFPEMHIVAHSMGGLVVRSFINECSPGCPYLASFISLNSPFGGDRAAQSGVEMSPIIVPVWRSMAREEAFIKSLYRSPLPPGLRYHLIFGYRNVGLMAKQSGDGTIVLESQLRVEAQREATTVRGFNATHEGIVDDAEVVAYVNQLLSDSPGRR